MRGVAQIKRSTCRSGSSPASASASSRRQQQQRRRRLFLRAGPPPPPDRARASPAGVGGAGRRWPWRPATRAWRGSRPPSASSPTSPSQVGPPPTPQDRRVGGLRPALLDSTDRLRARGWRRRRRGPPLTRGCSWHRFAVQYWYGVASWGLTCVRGIPELAVTEARSLASRHITKAVNDIKSTRNRIVVVAKQKEKSSCFNNLFTFTCKLRAA